MSKARTNNPTEVPGFSKPPADISPALRRYLESITEALDIRLGRRGDARDRAITLRELIDSGLAVELGNNPFNVSAAPPPPPPPPPANGTPTAPTNFSANGGYSIITCFWDYPNYGPHSHTEIWRHTADVIGDAQLVGISSGISFIDPVGGGKTYYYWARHVSLYDIQGPFQAANGDQAVTAVDVDALLAVLTGAITESQLYSNLKNRIDLIDASAAVTNSVAWRVAQEASARATAISNEASARATAINNEATARAAAISASIASLDDVMEYNNSTAYKKGGIVVYNGNLYEAKSSTTGNLPTNTTFWTFLGTYTNVGDIVKNNGSKIVEINTITSDSTSAAAQAIVGLKSTVENPTTGVVATSTALGALTTRVSTAEGNIVSNSSAITSLSDVVNHPTTGLSTRASSSALSALDSRVTAAEGVNTSQSTSITSLQNTIDHPTTGLATRASSAALTALDSRVTTAESTITSQGSSITSLTNTINHPTTGLATRASSAALSALDSRVSTAEGTITSQGASITSLTNTINDPSTGLATRASSTALSALDTRVTSAEGTITAQGNSITALQSTVNNPTTGVVATANAVSLLTTEIFPNGTAQASYIDQVNAAVGTNTAAIQAEATARANADGTLFGQYTVKVDLNGYVSGFGLASTVNNATPSSEFIVRADRFSIASPGQTTIIPFIVQTSPTTINGVPVDPGVYITDAVIRNGTITTAKIGLAQIDDARIASISAAKISTGSLDAARITVDNVTLDSYYDGSIGRNRLYIPDLGVKTAKIDNLAVSTLKIAGAAITVPQVYTSGEILVSSAIVMTGGGPSYTYNYVGTGNGDYVYVYDPWYGIQDYFFVGAGNGDYTRTVTNTTPTFTGATLVMETPQINIGVDSTAACQFVFYATMDAAHTLDCGQHLFMMMDKYDGNGYLLIGEQRVGTRTYSGDTKAILPITMTYTGTALQNVRIKVVSGTRLVDGNPGQGSNSSYLKNITLSVMGVKR